MCRPPHAQTTLITLFISRAQSRALRLRAAREDSFKHKRQSGGRRRALTNHASVRNLPPTFISGACASARPSSSNGAGKPAAKGEGTRGIMEGRRLPRRPLSVWGGFHRWCRLCAGACRQTCSCEPSPSRPGARASLCASRKNVCRKVAAPGHRPDDDAVRRTASGCARAVCQTTRVGARPGLSNSTPVTNNRDKRSGF